MPVIPPLPTNAAVWAGFHQELHRFVLRRVRDPDVAQDLLQEFFIKIHLHLDTKTQAERLAAWVHQIARNTVLDYFRQPRLATAPATDPEPLPAVLAEPLAPVDFTACLQLFVNRLPAGYRQALQLTELGTLSQKDYAAPLGISYSGAKSRVQRARRQLREPFTACCRIEADAYGNILAAQPRTGCGCPVVAVPRTCAD